MKIAVLITCHNRKKTTLGCLRRLLPQLGHGDMVFLVDDGNDGTGAVAEGMGGGRVRAINGSGCLYWAKGMRLAWDVAGDGWDCYLWLNDDTELDEDAVARLLSCVRESSGDEPCRVVVGDLANGKGEKVYGLRQDGIFSGNVVLVPKSADQKIGRICGSFHHAWADVDYAWRLKRAGVEVVSAGIVGKAEDHPIRPSLSGRTVAERWRMLFDPKGWCVHDVWLFRSRNYGFWAAVVSCAHLIVHVLVGER